MNKCVKCKTWTSYGLYCSSCLSEIETYNTEKEKEELIPLDEYEQCEDDTFED